MAYKTCPDCGSRTFEYGCINCDEMEYISMQGEYESPKKLNEKQNDKRSVATEDHSSNEARNIKEKFNDIANGRDDEADKQK